MLNCITIYGIYREIRVSQGQSMEVLWKEAKPKLFFFFSQDYYHFLLKKFLLVVFYELKTILYYNYRIKNKYCSLQSNNYVYIVGINNN
jgi:hypothetical protein